MAYRKTQTRRPMVQPVHIGELHADPQNARRHGERNLETITAALQEIGAARSVVIDEDAVVLAGNATVEAAAAAGITKVRVVDADGQTLVAVRRTGLTAAQKARLALFDNRAAELADGWNSDVLNRLAADGVSLEGLWSEDELVALLSGGAAKPGQTDPDAVPAPRATDVAAGDLFELGAHRLLCGDATIAGDVARLCGSARPFLMVTDPPYGVHYDPEWRIRAGVSHSDRVGAVPNDHRADWTPAWQLFPGPVAYVWHAGVFSGVVEASLHTSGFESRAQIIWRKHRFVLSRGHYHWQHEPCWYVVRKGMAAKWTGSRKEATVWNLEASGHHCPACGAVSAESDPSLPLDTTVWDIEERSDVATTHGTQKPVECMERPLRNHGGPSDLVYEPFSGSGTTLIAAERQRRSCLAIELDPAYVQMAIDRWEAYAGARAVKVGEAVRG